ncbi:hypothetical protein AAC387_Pa10g0801 [Persea americana]
MENTTPSPESIFKALLQRGWCFKEPEAIHTHIQSKIPARESEMGSLDSIQSELLNMDLRDIGGKSLLDPSSLKKSSHLQGHKILQLVSMKDIYQSNIDASINTSQRKRRLLGFCLTDGCSQVIAIEYLPIPAISEEIAPGTKMISCCFYKEFGDWVVIELAFDGFFLHFPVLFCIAGKMKKTGSN